MMIELPGEGTGFSSFGGNNLNLPNKLGAKSSCQTCPYNEQYAAWHLYKGGPANLTENVTLTRSDLISFSN
jgi:hypothetical protein